MKLIKILTAIAPTEIAIAIPILVGIIVLIAIILLCFVGCTELINTETQEVDATVTDIYHQAMWLQPIKCGKITTYITHPAQYKVTFVYEDITLTVDDKELYDRYKDKIGTTVKCDLITEYYDDNSVRQKLELKEKN